MPEERVIQTARSADLVTFNIMVDGEELSAVNQVLSISVEKEINRIPWAKIILLDGDPTQQDFVLSNEAYFVPGKEIEIKAGYHSDDETIFKGIVIRHNLKIRNDKTQLIVECRDKAVKLTLGRKSKYFYDSKDSDILEQIIADSGVDNDIEATSVEHPEMVQYRLSDWDFCVTRAQANGKVCVVDDGKMSVLAPDFRQSEKATLVYGATILDFDAEIDARNQFANVSSYGWDSANQDVLELEATPVNVQLNGNIQPEELASVINVEKLELRDGSGSTDASLQAWADAKDLFNRLSKVRGRVKFQGMPEVKPNTTIALSGVGDRFNGKAFVSAVRHEIAEGNWTIDAQFGFNPAWFSESHAINEVPAAGLFGAVNGLQIAKVTQIHDDPNVEYRVLVRLPLINNEDRGVWARVATLDAGNKRGSFFRPEIDDEVIVGFLNANPNHAVILGMLHSSALPAPLEPEEENNEKGFVTRSELKFIFNDDKKSIVLKTPAGKIITVDDDSGEIKIEDENGNVSTFDSSGIVLESQGDISVKASGDINLEGTNITLKANAQFKAEGSAGAEVSTSATAILKGSIVQIN